MINVKFWQKVREKWIRHEDPYGDIEGVIKEGGEGNIDELNAMLNGDFGIRTEDTSVDEINNLIEDLNDLGVDADPLGDLF